MSISIAPVKRKAVSPQKHRIPEIPQMIRSFRKGLSDKEVKVYDKVRERIAQIRVRILDAKKKIDQDEASITRIEGEITDLSKSIKFRKTSNDCWAITSAIFGVSSALVTIGVGVGTGCGAISGTAGGFSIAVLTPVSAGLLTLTQRWLANSKFLSPYLPTFHTKDDFDYKLDTYDSEELVVEITTIKDNSERNKKFWEKLKLNYIEHLNCDRIYPLFVIKKREEYHDYQNHRDGMQYAYDRSVPKLVYANSAVNSRENNEHETAPSPSRSPIETV